APKGQPAAQVSGNHDLSHPALRALAVTADAMANAPPFIPQSATSLRLQDIQRLEGAAEDGAGGGFEPLFEERGVDAAEVDVVLEVALVEVGQGGVLADDALLEVAAEEQQWR